MQITIEEAQAQLPALADRVRSGGEVIITKDGEPGIKLVACEPVAPAAGQPRPLHLLRGAFRISDDAIDALFLQPMAQDEVARLFQGEKVG